MQDEEEQYMQELQQNFEQNMQLNGDGVPTGDVPQPEYTGQAEVKMNPEEKPQIVKNDGGVKNEQGQPQIFDANKRLKENYERYCHIRYKEIITKRPDLMANTDLVTKIIVEEWEKKTLE